MAETFSILISAAALALSSGPHCALMCGPLVCAFQSFSSASAGKQHRPMASNLQYQAGRLSAYTALGGLSGAIGAAVSASVTFPVLWFSFLFSVLLGIYFILPVSAAIRLPQPGIFTSLRHRLSQFSASPWFFFLAGSASVLLPCGTLLAALGLALSSGNPLSGALVMIVFALVTSPVLLLGGLSASRAWRGWQPQSLKFRRMAGVFLLLTAIVSLLWRGGFLSSHHQHDFPPGHHHPAGTLHEHP